MKLLTAKDLPGLGAPMQALVAGSRAWQEGAGAEVGSCPPTGRPQTFPNSNVDGGNCDGNWVQCDGLLPAVTTAAGGGSGTLTFDVSASNFYQFQPNRLILVAVDAAAVETDLIRGLRITSISYAGIQIALGTAGIPALLFDPSAQHSLTTLRLPKLMVSGQDLVLTISNVDASTTATITGALEGWAWRQVV